MQQMCSNDLHCANLLAPACKMQLQYTWLTSTSRLGHGVQRSAASQSDVKRREATGQAPMYMLANSAEGTRVHAALPIAEGMHCGEKK
jgi:hypothetical protein